MSKPTLYGPTFSTYTRSMRMALAEKGVEYDLVEIDMLAGAHHQAEWKKRHPFERLPAFEHNGFAIYESNAIAHYIDDAFPGPRLAHPHIHRRTRDQQIVEVINAYGYKRIVTDIVVRYFFADKAKGPDMRRDRRRRAGSRIRARRDPGPDARLRSVPGRPRRQLLRSIARADHRLLHAIPGRHPRDGEAAQALALVARDAAAAKLRARRRRRCRAVG